MGGASSSSEPFDIASKTNVASDDPFHTASKTNVASDDLFHTASETNVASDAVSRPCGGLCSNMANDMGAGAKRDMAEGDSQEAEDMNQKRQRLHSAQLLGYMLSCDEAGAASDSEASTELMEGRSRSASTAESTAESTAASTRSRCYSSNSVKRGSDPNVGLANQCAELRQDVIGQAQREGCLIAELSAGSAKLREGKYLYVIMAADRESVRLLHEDDMDELMDLGMTIGHTSLVDAAEFKRSWASSWDEAEPEHFRRTVLYAGELMYEVGEGVVWWNNQSGHYLPPADGHTRVGFDPNTFAGFLG